MTCKSIISTFHSFLNAAKFFQKRKRKPARIPPQTPPAGGKSVEAERKILSPRKIDFRFAESAFRPASCPSNRGQNPERKTPFPFSKEISPPAKSEMQGVFFLSGLPRLCEAVAERFILVQKKFEQMI